MSDHSLDYMSASDAEADPAPEGDQGFAERCRDFFRTSGDPEAIEWRRKVVEASNQSLAANAEYSSVQAEYNALRKSATDLSERHNAGEKVSKSEYNAKVAQGKKLKETLFNLRSDVDTALAMERSIVSAANVWVAREV